MTHRSGPTGVLVHRSESLEFLVDQPEGHFELIYIDPPFNTGRRQTLRRTRTVRDEEGGDRVGFGGARYRSEYLGEQASRTRTTTTWGSSARASKSCIAFSHPRGACSFT